MKFLILTSQVFQLGGAEKLSLELVYGFNNTNIKADLGIVFKSPDLENTNAEIIKSLEKKPGNWFSLDLPINPKLSNIIKGVFDLIKLIKKRKYTHIESSLVTPSIIATVACMLTGCKHIVGFHQTYQPFLAKNPKYKLFFFFCRLSPYNHYYGISDYVVRTWINSSKIRFKSIVTIYNSYNDDFNYYTGKVNKNLIFETDKIVILCVGRITKNKGYQILFDSIKYDLKSRNLALYFLGSQDYQTEGEQEELDRINAEIESLGLINHVFFLGFRRNTLDFLSACDLLVHPTKHEGFGLVLIEAMIMKKPIITTNVEAIPEILEGTGIVQLPFGDTTELRKKIIGFVENQNIFKNCISNGFERAKCFNLNRRVQAIIDYSSVLKS